ncbi:lipopolysaccharide export system ATP-binding protein [Candidatus Kinetoplastibacterium desouzaii TCC079E]|uniref:Lipopolysaccharide export system ATP-binding protein LptB n=1 Tax=Candidatus Kinetoplastidibacterium desouzai TCC079E TaxID=1208919 RepID=M1LNC3_9PROT|nr:LPS export ABC transporter ATP-binding protein [Candidatus Kinetoplastibacterium desouzaii]AGF47202.1 lipopolysaccharide export system ATP-binding protein [Candidatus Kinetoplastibacterium desouzaii TCC079E]
MSTKIESEFQGHLKKTGVLKASNLQKSYNKRLIVQNVSLKLNSGEIIGLLGPNGAGKTTCFYMILGLIQTELGSILIDDIDITKLPIYKRARMGLSYLPQDISVFRELTVEENIRAIVEITETTQRIISNSDIKRITEILLEELDIIHVRNNMAISLSGGERRRLEIARTLATYPKFILLDEPFAGVDPIAVIELQKIITSLKKLGIGILITDHNVRETLGICDRAYIINDGKVLAEGNPDEIILNQDVRKIYLGEHFSL